jgi:hypothetical protein
MPELDEKKRIIAYDTVNDPDENYYALIDNGTSGTGKVSIKGLGPANMISDQYSDSSTYKVGDLCIHNNKLYVCTVAINTPHAFNLSEWELDTLGNYASQIKQSLSKLQVYSTAKFDTGKKWIDGKTIWGKVYTGYAVSNSTVDLDTITIDTIIHGYGWARSENNNSWGIPSGRQDGYENRPLYNTNTHKLSVQFGSAYLNGTLPFVFTIEFTE